MCFYKSFLLNFRAHCVKTFPLVFDAPYVTTDTNKVASLVFLVSVYDRAFWERLMSETFVPGRPLNSTLQYDFKLHFTTLNSYLRVADKNVIFFPHNFYNFHISSEACNRLFSWQDYWNLQLTYSFHQSKIIKTKDVYQGWGMEQNCYIWMKWLMETCG